MLKIHFGDLEETLYDAPCYFDNTYEEEWITSDISKIIIKDIDKSEVLGPNCLLSPVLGKIPVYKASAGAKTLLLMIYEPEVICNGSNCGDRCARWMLEIGRMHDVTVTLCHLMDFGMGEEFEIEILNNHVIVHNMEELMPHAFKFLKEI